MLTQRITRGLAERADRAYYRLAFGRRYPGSERVDRVASALEDVLGRTNVPREKALWEGQFASGRWDGLKTVDDLPHYAVIGAYARRLRPGAAVLDVGCGEGLLVDQLDAATPYLGVDLSETAVASAARAYPGRAFVAGDAATFTPPSAPDVVVFNETVYYFTQPVDVVRRYARGAAPGALAIVSTFASPRADAIARQLRAAFPLVHATQVTNGRGTWTVAVLALDPRPTS